MNHRLFVLLLAFILILNINESFSQKKGEYILKNKSYYIRNKKLSYLISLYPTNEYVINILYSSSDLGNNKLISFGDYTVKNDTIIMKDKLNEYYIKMLYENNELHVIKSFNWMLNLKFEYSKGFYGRDSFSLIPNIDLHEKLLNKLNNYNIENNTDYNFAIRTYYRFWMGEVVEKLSFSSDSTYKFTFDEIILLEGTWKRNKNIIILWDNTLNYNFYIFINKDSSLNCVYLPSNEGREVIYNYSK